MTFCISKLNKQFDLFQPANQWTSERITTSNFRGVYSKWERIKQSLYIRLVYTYFSFAWANVNIKFNAMDARAHDSWESWLYSWIWLPSITVTEKSISNNHRMKTVSNLRCTLFTNRFICFLISNSSIFKALHSQMKL